MIRFLIVLLASLFMLQAPAFAQTANPPGHKQAHACQKGTHWCRDGCIGLNQKCMAQHH